MIKIHVVNMIPNNWSDEQNQDCEPCLSVNPSNSDEIVATAFTFDNPAGTSAISPAMTGAWAPVYYSTDGGVSWSLHFVLPTASGAILPTFDVTARFGGTSGIVYSGLISSATGSIIFNRAPNALTRQTTLVTRSGDQPFAEATTALVGPFIGNDMLYVGYNGSVTRATIDQSLNAASGVPTFTANSVDFINTSFDGPKTRTAIHSSGVIYGAFYSLNTDGTWDVVVIKDTNWGASSPSYKAIGAGGQGVIVASHISVGASGTEDADFGNDRRGWELAIAVDPHDANRLYLAYNTGTKASDYTLHLVRSTDGGLTWSGDARTIVVAKNPGVAVNSLGDVGFVYQQVVGPLGGSNWVTVLEYSRDDFATVDSHTLADVPSSVPVPTTHMATYIGDYINLKAVGKDFCGIFSANNTPEAANFPSGVHFQRNVNMGTGTLLGNDGVTVISPSIDPFFFKVTVKTGSVVTSIADHGYFGQVCLGSFRDELLTVNNNGNGPLRITSITVFPTDFQPPSVLSYPILLSPGDSIDVVLRFQPTSLGAKVGTVTVFSDDPAGPHKFRVSGNSEPPRLSLYMANAGEFGKVCVASFKDEDLILNNSGKCTLVVTAIDSSAADFIVPNGVSFPLTIAAGNFLPVPIRFESTGLGAKTATITVVSNDPAGPHNIQVSGDAPSGELKITGSTVFGGVKCCHREQRVLSLCNTGECSLQVTHVGFKRNRRHFRLINNPFPTVLRAGSCLNLVIQYVAKERVSKSCELVIHCDDPHEPIRHLDVIAYTIWDCCKCGCKCCKEDCDCCKPRGDVCSDDDNDDDGAEDRRHDREEEDEG